MFAVEGDGNITGITNSGYVGWITATAGNLYNVTFTSDATADYLTVVNGGVWKLNASISGNFNGEPTKIQLPLREVLILILVVY
jgi:hypothetical protein